MSPPRQEVEWSTSYYAHLCSFKKRYWIVQMSLERRYIREKNRFGVCYDVLYTARIRTGKLGESQGRKVTGLLEGSNGRRTAEES